MGNYMFFHENFNSVSSCSFVSCTGEKISGKRCDSKPGLIDRGWKFGFAVAVSQNFRSWGPLVLGSRMPPAQEMFSLAATATFSVSLRTSHGSTLLQALKGSAVMLSLDYIATRTTSLYLYPFWTLKGVSTGFPKYPKESRQGGRLTRYGQIFNTSTHKNAHTAEAIGQFSTEANITSGHDIAHGKGTCQAADLYHGRFVLYKTTFSIWISILNKNVRFFELLIE